MGLRRLGCALAGLIALTCLATACGSSRLAAVSRQTASSRKDRSWSLVALGDSVPRGTNCHCTPYPPLTARDLTRTSGDAVTADNDSVAGATTSDVLRQLKSDTDAKRDVAGSEVVEIEVGANDVGYSAACGTRVACYAPRARRKVLIVLLDYWNVWLGGRYAAARGEAYVNAAEQVTDEVNSVIKT